MSLDAAQVRAHAAAAFADRPGARIVAFSLAERPRDLESFVHDGAPVQVVWAPSELALRFALDDVGDEGRAVVFTPLDERSLADDVLMRLERRRLLPVDPWEAVRVRFRATSVLPTVRQQRALAAALLQLGDGASFPAARAGVVDDDLAWNTLLGRLLDGRTTPAQLIDSGGLLRRRLVGMPPELAPPLRERLAEIAGRVGDVVVSVATLPDDVPDTAALSAAIAAEALLEFTERTSDASRAAILQDRLRRTIGVELDASTLHQLADAARRALEQRADNGDHAGVRARLDAADAWLASAELIELRPWGSLLPAAFDARCDRLADAARGALPPGEQAERIRGSLASSLDAVRTHLQCTLVPDARDAAERLAALAWRATLPALQGHAAVELAREHMVDGAELDRLRYAAEVMDPGRQLGTISRELAAFLRRRSDDRNAAFAGAVAEAMAAHELPPGLMPQEQALAEVVAPLAASHRVLLLVMDGMSWHVARRLVEQMTQRYGLGAWAPASDDGLRPVLAVLPSVTEYARTSLLTGELRSGRQSDEKQLLPRHHALLRAGAVNSAVFHLGDLRGNGAEVLGTDVAAALGADGPRLTACVVNVIDDQLAGAEQLAVDWRIEAMRPLASLLDTALRAERVVVFTSDHGHVWDHGDAALPGGSSARYRPDDGSLRDGEVRLEGPRVRAVAGVDSVVALAREGGRYTGRAAGYHGGVTLQEAIAPLLVLAPEAPQVRGLELMSYPLATPAWAEARAADDSGPLERERASVAPTEPAAASQAQLSLVPEPEPVAPPDRGRVAAPAWLDALVETAAYREHVERVLPDARTRASLRDLLAALAQRGGRMRYGAVADAIDLPAPRVQRFVSLAARGVNLDGYQALSVDRSEGTIVLDAELLCRQFGVEVP